MNRRDFLKRGGLGVAAVVAAPVAVAAAAKSGLTMAQIQAKAQDTFDRMMWEEHDLFPWDHGGKVVFHDYDDYLASRLTEEERVFRAGMRQGALDSEFERLREAGETRL